MSKPLSIGEVARLVGRRPSSIRYYEQIERLREIAERKLPQITALIERSQLVRDWLACAARCECPNLDQCPLFEDPAVLPDRDNAGTTGELPGRRLA